MDEIREFFLKVKRTFLSKKFIEFCFLGIFNTLNDAIFSWIYHFVMQENVAAVLGYFTALIIAFFMSSRFIFKRKPSLQRYARFCLSYIPNFIIYFLVTFITINTMELSQFWGTILAAVAGGPITFVIIKIYAFGNK